MKLFTKWRLIVERSRAEGEWVYCVNIVDLLAGPVALAGQPLGHALGLVFGLGASAAFDEIARHDRLDSEIWLSRGQIAALRMLMNFYRQEVWPRRDRTSEPTSTTHDRQMDVLQKLLHVNRAGGDGHPPRETPPRSVKIPASQ